MSARARDVFFGGLADGLHEPTEKRIRVVLGDRTIADTTRAVLVWEPRRIVPSYAVPVEDLDAELVPVPHQEAGPPSDGSGRDDPSPADLPYLHPGIPFRVHSSQGESLTVRAGEATAEAAAFRPEDPALAGYAVLDFFAFDAWYEEEERIVGHPRDPFHRIDILHGSRHVLVQLEGRVLAESTRPYLLFETNIPVRFYMPREDVRWENLQPSDTTSYCAYKGQASYWSVDGGGTAGADVAWTYERPLREAAEIAGRIAFFSERADVVVDGRPLPRPRTPWSRGRSTSR